MHCICGGNFKGKEYSCMFDANARYKDMTPNEKYYFHYGICDDIVDEDGENALAILLFGVEEEELVYARELSDGSEKTYEQAMKDIIDTLPCCTETAEENSTHTKE